MKKIFVVALATLLLLAGCSFPGDIAAPPPTEPAAATAAPAPVPPPPRSYNGIAEGDVLPGELTFYCECAKCNGKWAGLTADGTVLADLGPEDLPVVGANWLPLQSLVEVDGTVYRIADRGSPRPRARGAAGYFHPGGPRGGA